MNAEKLNQASEV